MYFCFLNKAHFLWIFVDSLRLECHRLGQDSSISFIVLSWGEDYRELKTMPALLPRPYFSKTNSRDELREVVAQSKPQSETSSSSRDCRAKTDDLSRLSPRKCIFISNQSKSNYSQYLGILGPWH